MKTCFNINNNKIECKLNKIDYNIIEILITNTLRKE
jgi:hypothetical protein